MCVCVSHAAARPAFEMLAFWSPSSCTAQSDRWSLPPPSGFFSGKFDGVPGRRRNGLCSDLIFSLHPEQSGSSSRCSVFPTLRQRLAASVFPPPGLVFTLDLLGLAGVSCWLYGEVVCFQRPPSPRNLFVGRLQYGFQQDSLVFPVQLAFTYRPLDMGLTRRCVSSPSPSFSPLWSESREMSSCSCPDGAGSTRKYIFPIHVPCCNFRKSFDQPVTSCCHQGVYKRGVLYCRSESSCSF